MNSRRITKAILTEQLERSRAREDSLKLRVDELLKLGEDTETRRFIAKAESQKAMIQELRYAIKAAVLSMRDLAYRTKRKVTPQHMAELAAKAEKLVEYTDLPR